jgi:hypothetical protein
MCEGWSLEIGMAFHGSVVRRDRRGEPARWIASIIHLRSVNFQSGKLRCTGSKN